MKDTRGEPLTFVTAAALAGVEAPRARQALSTLHRAHLVSSGANGRYGMHDLLRAYAAERASELPEADGAAALDRLRRYHRRAAATAVR